MANPSSKATVPASRELQTSSSSPAGAASSTKSDDGANPYEAQVMRFFKLVGMHDPNVENYSSRDFYSNLLCNTLKPQNVRRGHVTCFATVTPAVAVILCFELVIVFIRIIITTIPLSLFWVAELFWWDTWRGRCSDSGKGGDSDG